MVQQEAFPFPGRGLPGQYSKKNRNSPPKNQFFKYFCSRNKENKNGANPGASKIKIRCLI
jgi:hypothetical protein